MYSNQTMYFEGTMNQEEWDEMNALRRAISDNPASVRPDKQERFTELLVRSWPATGDLPLQHKEG